MGLAGNDQLHGAFWIGEQSQKAIRVVQQRVWPLIRGKSACESPCQHSGINQFGNQPL